MSEGASVRHVPRAVTVEFRRDGGTWHASSPDITGLAAEGADLAEVQREAVTSLRGWLDPVHRVELRIMDEAPWGAGAVPWREALSGEAG